MTPKNAKGSESEVRSPASILFGVIWRVWRIISFRHWGRQNGRVKKSSQNAMNFAYSITDGADIMNKRKRKKRRL
jgi:hypothetical protein